MLPLHVMLLSVSCVTSAQYYPGLAMDNNPMPRQTMPVCPPPPPLAGMGWCTQALGG